MKLKNKFKSLTSMALSFVMFITGMGSTANNNYQNEDNEQTYVVHTIDNNNDNNEELLRNGDVEGSYCNIPTKALVLSEQDLINRTVNDRNKEVEEKVVVKLKSEEEVFKELSLVDKEVFLLDKYGLTYEELIEIIYGDLAFVEEKGFIEEYDEMKKYFAILNEEKISYILEKENLTKEQFDIVAAGVIDEAKDQGHCYVDAYGVINSMHNRTKSKRWNRNYENGDNVYYQFIRPGQYAVYFYESYKEHLGQTDVIGYQAVIDYLYSEESIIDYMSFNSWNTDVSDNYLIEGGNRYYEVLSRDERIEKELVLNRALKNDCEIN